jgi:ABC-type sugar transport system ATPase subunit
MLEAQGIKKSYGGVTALKGANINVRAGSVHALLGENGAGKSTLVKIIAGAVQPDEGTLRLDGSEVTFSSTADAAKHGVAVVSQELSLFPDLDVLSNLFPMREPRRGPFVNRRSMEAQARPVLDELELDVAFRQPLGSLTLAQRQLVEVAKALVKQPRVLILDEPTSALEASSTEALMKVLRVLRDREVAVVFVSHILEEVMALCDDITILRDGNLVMEAKPRAELTVPLIVEAMIGQKIDATSDASAKQEAARAAIEEVGEIDIGEELTAVSAGDVRLEGVSVDKRLRDVTFKAPPGEVVGIAGLAGSGHLAIIELLSGQIRPASGTVALPGDKRVRGGLRGAVGSGVALVTGDRRRFGLMLDKPLWENIGQVRAIAMGRDGIRVSKGKLRENARTHVERLNVRTSSVDVNAGTLSGGNQQKVVFAKWLDSAPSVLLLDDPTRGVDVGAKAEMHAIVRSAADAGTIVILASTDIDELAEVCDRVAVFYQGGICADLRGDDLKNTTLLEAMNTGGVAAAA